MAVMQIKNPDNIQCTLSMTMTLKEWKEIKTSLSTKMDYSAAQVTREIVDLVHQMEKTYYSNLPDKDKE